MDTTEQKLAQALQREVHLQMSIDAERRCSDSLRAALKKCKDEIADMPFNHAEEIGNLTTELTIAKQDRGNALLELRSARAVIGQYADDECWDTGQLRGWPCENIWWVSDYENRNGYDLARNWLTLHAQQTEAPLLTRVPIEEITIRNLTPYPLDLDWEFQVTEREIKLIGVIVKTEEAKSKESDPEAEAEQAKEAMWEKEQ